MNNLIFVPVVIDLHIIFKIKISLAVLVHLYTNAVADLSLDLERLFLFYLKGVAPPQVRTMDIYKGVIPFIIMQAAVVISLMFAPEWYGLTH